MSDEAQKTAAKRDRSPKFPYISLSKALERISVLHAKVKRHEARVADIAADWDLSPKSSSTDRTVAALQSFGLIEDLDSGENRKIKLTEAGARIVADTRPGVREELLSKAALLPPAIRLYADKWAEGRPDDSHALGTLQFDGGFTEDGAKMFLRVFDETIRFTHAQSHDKESDKFDGQDEEDEGGGSDKKRPPLDQSSDHASKRRGVKSGMKEDIFTLAEGDVRIEWPESISSESFQDLEDWTKLMLRKIKRSIVASSEVVNSATGDDQ